jgi:hypothetical protein
MPRRSSSTELTLAAHQPPALDFKNTSFSGAGLYLCLVELS